MSKSCRSFTADQKADVVLRHLKDKVAISDLAAELGTQPTQIYQWVATALAQVEKAFLAKSGRRSKSSEAKLEHPLPFTASCSDH